jgi:hypothetical protein
LASDVKNRDDKRRQQNHPDPYERGGRGILRSHGTLSVVHRAASSKCAACRPRTTAQFFEAKKVSSDSVVIQTEESKRRTNLQTCPEYQSRAPGFTRREVYLA